jgi:orotate phosphoribosyltransferase
MGSGEADGADRNEVDPGAVRERLRRKLASCIKTGKVRLSSGKETDFYFDGRLVSLDPEGSVLIGELLLEEVRKRGIEGVGGLTSGADPITSAIGVLAHQKNVPLKLFYVRKAAKEHGMQKRVEGPPLPAGLRVAIVDDVITTGGSLLQARDALRDEAGVQVVAAMVVIDREEGGREKLESEGIAVTSLFRRRDFLS